MLEEEEWEESEVPDPQEERAADVLRQFFVENRERVFSSRQVEVIHEREYFHWVTNRAVRTLIEEGLVRSEVRELAFGGSVKLLWHRSYRYPRRAADRLVGLVNEYSDPNVGAALGLHGELMVLEGFARYQFVVLGRHVREHGGLRWTETEHDLDFVLQRDGRSYGVEVKNTLSYMDYEELDAKMRMCDHLGIVPVVVARMLPKSWIEELRLEGGFGLILKYQLYPLTHADLARRIRDELGMPADSPKALANGTMARFLSWHHERLR